MITRTDPVISSLVDAMGDIEHDGLQHDCGDKNNQDVKERIVLVAINPSGSVWREYPGA